MPWIRQLLQMQTIIIVSSHHHQNWKIQQLMNLWQSLNEILGKISWNWFIIPAFQSNFVKYENMNQFHEFFFASDSDLICWIFSVLQKATEKNKEIAAAAVKETSDINESNDVNNQLIDSKPIADGTVQDVTTEETNQAATTENTFELGQEATEENDKEKSKYITNFRFRRYFNGKISSNIIYLFNFIIVITILVVNDDKSTEAVPKKSGLFARFSSKDKTPATPPNTPTTAVTTPNTENETQLQGMYVHNNIMWLQCSMIRKKGYRIFFFRENVVLFVKFEKVLFECTHTCFGTFFHIFWGHCCGVIFCIYVFFYLQTNNVLCACGVMAMNCGNFKNILFMFLILWTEKPYSLCHFSLKCINIEFLSLSLQFLGIYLRYCWFLLIHASNILNTHQLELNYSLFFF